MQHIVDLHIHSCFSRATSKGANLEGMYYWAKIKGINVLGTGDFTHPSWFAQMQEKLTMTESGLYKLKDEISKKIDETLPLTVRGNIIRFVPTVEISNIYSKTGKVRKLHNCIVVPSLEVASYINNRLDKIGNINSDGRPILGLDSKDLLEIVLQSHDDSLFFPAHIWTPWFAMFGSKSGFDSIDEAFEDLAKEIKAIETGLSSDPFMNWRLSQLDNITILSNSDAHSPQKLGREANVIDSPLNYRDIICAIKNNDHRMVGTIEFFPQEGKYHYDGHKDCGFSCSPDRSLELKGICPICNKPLTLGVDYRVSSLADKSKDYKPKSHKSVEYIVPLPELIAEIFKVGSGSKKVNQEYNKIYSTLGDEFSILRTIPISEIKKAGFSELADIISRMRKGDLYIEPGYDGVFGKIRLFKSDIERKTLGSQMSLL